MKTEKKKFILIMLSVFVVCGYAFAGQTIYVDSDAPQSGDGTSWATAFNYLQDALFNATPGTEIIKVAEGIYKPHLNTYSAAPPSRTDTFQLINGVTIKGGYAGLGQPDPNARDISLYETILSGDMNGNDLGVNDPCDLLNESSRSDNAYHVITANNTDANAVLDGFTITAGNANGPTYEQTYGGGIFISTGNPSVKNCNFFANSADARGGAFFNLYSALTTFNNCIFNFNSSQLGGALGGYIQAVNNCTFKSNDAIYLGGAIWGSVQNITNSQFSANTATSGGAFFCFSSSNLTNCIFYGNSAVTAAAIFAEDTYIKITNCTVTGNLANIKCGGILNNEGPTILTNSIIFSNEDNSGTGQSAQVDTWDPPSINYCCIQGWTGSLGGVGNIGDNPLFADADGIDNIIGTEDDNLRLLPGSPCIDTGDPNYVPAPGETDLDGNPRIVNGTVDMGAYEFQGIQTLYVDMDASGANNGSSWADAFVHLQDALIMVKVMLEVEEIRVAQGTYKPDQGAGQTPGDREATFLLISDMVLLGGYAGFGQPDPNERDIQAYETILSGDLSGNDVEVTDPCDLLTEPTRAENSYHVVTVSLTETQATLDGLVITGGNANIPPGSTADPRHRSGGGLRTNYWADIVLRNCTFHTNSALLYGGALLTGSNRPVLVNCVFSHNTAEFGGAVYFGDSYSPGPLLTGCAFNGNSAREGGAIFGMESDIDFTQCTFSGNSADFGGALYSFDSDDINLTNCTLSNNTAQRSGGGIFGEGIFYIDNTILWGNTDLYTSGEWAQINTYDPVYINYSCVQGWTGNLGGTGNIGEDPLLVDANGTDNTVGTEDDNLRLLFGSPCIDTGDNTAVPPSVLTDLDGKPRIIGDTVDMGAYEFWGPVYVDDDAQNDPGPGDPQVSDPLENGTEDHPFDTIQEAIDLSVDWYAVLVRQGSYFEPAGGSTIDFLGKNITLKSEDPTDWDIIDNTIIRSYVQFSGTEDPNCTFTGFKIRNLEGAIYGNHTHATISHCNISGNGPCGATVIKDCHGTISNCLITDNLTFFYCGVNPVVFGCNGLIKNCTIANNISGVSVGTATIENCIIYNNAGSQLDVGGSETLNISYCNLQGGLEGITGGGSVNPGPGNIDTDPCFVRAGYWEGDPLELIEGDYHLRSEGWRWNTDSKSWAYDYITSRCIDAGNPGSPLRDELMSVPRDPDNTWGVNLRINMGAFGGTGQAGMPPHGWALLADLNNDGIINYLDFAYQTQDWQATAPEQPGDQNRDGVVNKIDLAALARNWLQVTVWFE
jgi:hypothetical protein